jgi:hypothetical protein
MSRYVSVFFFILLWTSTVIADENVSGRISGAWIPLKIGPISGGLIYAYNSESGPPPQRDKSHRVPDAIATTSSDGKFTLELAEGTYYLSTRKKFAGATPGPPQDGDLYGLSRNKKGELIKYTVTRGKTTNVGILRRATVFKTRETSVSKTPAINVSAGMAAIAGRLTNTDGSPLADAVVQVYDNQESRGMPVYVSLKTGKDGKYIVQIDQEGTYFLTVRTANAGGRPKAGDIFGIYGGEPAQPVEVKQHNVTEGIDIQAGKFDDNRPE